jgi:hypothetical protein
VETAITDQNCQNLPVEISKYVSGVYTMWFKNIVGVSVAYNFQTGSNKIKLLTEYERVTQNVLFGNAILILQIIKLFELRFHIT